MVGLRRIDRYVLRELTGPTVLGFSLYTFILLMNAFFLLAQNAISKNLGWSLIGRLFVLELPNLLVLTIPMSVLLGVLIGIGRLSSDSEWIALQSAGRGPSVLLRPVGILGLIATLLSGYVYWVVVPASRFAQRSTRMEVALASNMAADLKPRTFYPALDGIVLFVDEIRPGSRNGRLEGVLIHRIEKEGGTQELILARAGNLYPAPDRSGDLEMDLYDGTVHRYRNDDPDTYRPARFRSYHLPLPAPAYLAAFRQPPNKGPLDMTASELRREIRDARASDDPVLRAIRLRNATLEIQLRIALPFASFLFALLSVPLGVTRVRSGKGAGFALSLFVLLVYYVIFIIFRDQAARGEIATWLGAWSGNLVVLPWFAIAALRMRHPSGEREGWLVRLVRLPFRFVRSVARRIRRRGRRASDAIAVAAEAETVSRVADARLVGRLDAYVGLHFLRVFLFALLSAYLIYFIIELRDLVSDALRNDLSMMTVVRYLGLYAPGMIPFTLPVACLAGSIVSVTLLTRTGELTAIKAGGISMRRATVPMLAMTLALCAVYFVVDDRIAPSTNQKAAEVKDLIQNRAPRTYGMALGGRWVFGTDRNVLYNYRLYDESTQTFQGLSVFTLDRRGARILDHRYAASAQWNGSDWVLATGWYRSFPPDASIGEYRRFETVTLPLDPPAHFVQREMLLSAGDRMVDQMNVHDLKREIRDLRRSGYDTTRLEVAYFGKFSRPLTPLIMVLLGLPFAFRIGRRGSLYGIGVAILLVIVYWATFAIFNALGLETILPPFLAAWAPNILYGLLGTYLLLYVPT